jgi:proteic killer suppression protein
VEVTFNDPGLDDLEANEQCKSKFDKAVVRAFRRLMRFIRDSMDERDLQAWPGKNFEKLKGNRSHQHAMRINDQWRLVFEIKKGNPKNTIHVIEIVNDHKG